MSKGLTRGVTPLPGVALMAALSFVGAQPAHAAGKLLVQLHVTKADLMPRKPGSKYIDGFVEGGQFEILLKPSSVPVQAPMCRQLIIARMPSSDPTRNDTGPEIAAKKRLFDKFEALKAGRIAAVDVAVDAAPYGKQVSASPRVVRLSECNLFFLPPKP
ncbi:hypothetical protein [Novosphingobium rosa]|uniref:hypothetical protein n=1 Tax=Novosphingobium rosa TaxID=76978 RepID=UPI00082FEF1D|nr:hypothetical protein [Novosphingobium rosa]